jgi:phosphatidylglycerophosphate synthase
MESIKELRKICQQKGYEEHITIRFHRIFTIYITRICLAFDMGANSVTVASFFLAIAGGYFYLQEQFLLGSIWFFAFYIFDNVDGEIARYRKSSSILGAWLDTTVGHLVYPYFFFALGSGLFFQSGQMIYLYLGILAAMAKLIERSVPRSSFQDKSSEKQGNGQVSEVKMWVSYIGKFSVLFPTVVALSAFGWEKWFIWFFAIYLTFIALSKLFLTGFRIYKVEYGKKNF